MTRASCEDIQLRLEEALTDERALPPQLSEHLESCDQCKEHSRFMELLLGERSAAPSELELRASVARVMSALGPSAQPRRAPLRLAWLVAPLGAALVAALFFVVMPARHQHEQPEDILSSATLIAAAEIYEMGTRDPWELLLEEGIAADFDNGPHSDTDWYPEDSYMYF